MAARRREDRAEARRWWVFALLSLPLAVVAVPALLLMLRGTRKAKSFRALTLRTYIAMLVVWLFHELGFRDDEVGRDMFWALPGNRGLLLWPAKMYLRTARLLSGLYVDHRVWPVPPGPLHARMSALAFFDDSLALSEVRQVVLLGAGLASHAHSGVFLNRRTQHVFELNERRDHAAKKRLLRECSGVKAEDYTLTAVKDGRLGADEGWLDELEAGGLDPHESTLFVVHEGMWLWDAAVAEAFFGDVSALMAENPASRLAFAYVDDSRVEGEGFLGRAMHGTYSFGLPDGEDSDQEEWVRNFGDMEPILHERVGGGGFMLCASPLRPPPKFIHDNLVY